MRRDVFAAARFLVLPTIGLVGVAVFAPGRVEPGVRIYALILCATAIALLLSALRRAYPDETMPQEPDSVAPRRAIPPDLGRLEHEVALAVAGSFDLHYRLVPRLRSLAAGLLSSRRKVSLESDPGGARSALGEEAWELVRPDRPAPQDRLTKGITPSELDRVVDALEAI